jgi:transcriptional regulator with XRE-family HTH domain
MAVRIRRPRKLQLVPDGLRPMAEVEVDDGTLSDAQRLGQVIRAARRAKGWSLRDLDRAAGVASNYLWSIEKPGKNIRRPGAEVLGKLADALDLSLDDLYAQVGWRSKRIAAPGLEEVLSMVAVRPELKTLIKKASQLSPEALEMLISIAERQTEKAPTR